MLQISQTWAVWCVAGAGAWLVPASVTAEPVCASWPPGGRLLESLGPPRWPPLRLLLLLWLLLLFLWLRLLLLLLLLLLLPRVGIFAKTRAVPGGGDGCGGAGVLLGPLTGLGSWLACKKESINNFLPATLRRLTGASVSPCSASHSMGMNDAPASVAASRKSLRKRSIDSRGSMLNGAG